MTTRMDELKTILKSILISSHMKLRVHQLNNEYKSLIGRNIPFAEYGYRDLVQLLKCLPDILTVDGDDMNSLVTHKFGNRQVRIKKKKFKDRKPNAQNKAQAIKKEKKPEKPATSIESQKNAETTTFPNQVTAKYSSPLGINFDMLIDYKNEKLRLSTEIDYGKIAEIRRRISPKLHQEQQNKKGDETKKTGLLGLRYPKTTMSTEKNINVVGVSHSQPVVQAGSRTSMSLEKVSVLKTEAQKLTQYEYFKQSEMVKKNTMKIPSIIKSTPKLLKLSENTSICKNQMASPREIPPLIEKPISLMDLPIPSMLPEVPKEFTSHESNNLIDFHGVLPNFPPVPETPRREPRVKSIPFVDVLRLVEMLKTTDLN
ncbi:uncharacterized protein LOC123674975 [Harmonia axyridis]|uniref:uncharacterized protein LOC123674975 n=1 Tax=Harmonia axyridis TaxID=115357 RepID=UPI001E2794FD|nr:uncharacterized protein LOC123674975 [Harmonia axyridis]